MRHFSRGVAVVVLGGIFSVACGGAAQQPPPATPNTTTPTTTTATATPGKEKSDPWTLPEGPRDPSTAKPAEPGPLKLDDWAKASKTKGVPAAPASCAAFAKRVPAPANEKAPADLVVSLLEKDPAKRDAMLAAFEGKDPKDPKVVVLRAMRAELAPVECADVLTDPLLTGPNAATASGAAAHALVGLSLASKLSRTAATAPVMKDAADKEKVKAFIQGPLRAWMVEQAAAIDALSVPAAGLSGLARGVTAIEAGMADLRLVDKIRSAPTPSTWDKELKAVYEASLDEALEPRKVRGRDAALVGLADFASAGIMQDARIDRARSLLSKLYGGRRIDALDGLLLPEGEMAAGNPVSSVVLAFVPTAGPSQEWFAKMNVAPAPPVKSPRARFEMGKRYWRRVDFVEAAYGAKSLGAGVGDKGDPNRLLLALSLTLAKGPGNAKEMMMAPSPAALNLNHTEALDALVAEGGKVAGMAAFDAAHLRSLSPPEGAEANAYLMDVSARFKKAASLLEDPTMKKAAEARAADAEAAAKAGAAAK